MLWQFSPYIVPLLASAAISSGLAVYAWRRRSVSGTAAFTWAMIGMTGWSLANVLQWSSATLSGQLFWAQARFLGTELLVAAFLVFSIQYAGRHFRLTRNKVMLLALLPVVTLFLTWTNAQHELFWRQVTLDSSGPFAILTLDFGPGFWLHTAYDYLLLTASVFMLIQLFRQSPRLYRIQIAALLIGTGLPWTANLLYVTKVLNPLPGLDLTPFGFTLGGLVMAFAFFRAGMFDIDKQKSLERALRHSEATSLAILESIEDAYFEADLTGDLTFVNASFCKAINYSREEVVGKNFRRFTDPAFVRPVFEAFNHVYRTGRPRKQLEYRLVRRDGSLGIGECSVSLIRDVDNKPTGFRGIIRDITDRKRLEEALQKAFDAAEKELEIGRQIQASFLPDRLPQPDGWEIAGCFQAAREVAGDFYDVFSLSRGKRIGLVVADVCDKGVGAALFMALFRSLLRAFADQHYSSHSMVDFMDDEGEGLKRSVLGRRRLLSTGMTALMNAMTLTNNYIANNHGETNMFATIFFGVLDPDRGKLAYINGGHEPPVIIGSGRIKQRLHPTGPAVGMLPDLNFEIAEVQMEPGDMLVAFTDGVTEARGADDGFFGEERLLRLLLEPATTAAAIVQQIEAALNSHTAGAVQSDDITLLAARRRTCDNSSENS